MEDKGRASARPFGLCAGMKRGAWVMFAAFCLIAGSEWLMMPVATVVRGLAYLVVGLAAVAVNGRGRWSRWDEIGRLAVAAVLVLGVPETMASWAAGYVPGALWTATLAVVPAMVVLMVAQRSDGGEGVRRLLVPALAAFGGVLLLIPVEFPRLSMGLAGLGVMVLGAVLVSIACDAIHGLLQRFNVVQAIAIFCLANSMVLLGTGLLRGWRGTGVESGSWAMGVATAVEVVLLVALLRAVEPVRLSARFLLVPLVAIVEGYVLLRPELTLRMVAGAALLGGGAAMLLLPRSEEEAGLSLR